MANKKLRDEVEVIYTANLLSSILGLVLKLSLRNWRTRSLRLRSMRQSDVSKKRGSTRKRHFCTDVCRENLN